jgi:hypothetical protein
MIPESPKIYHIVHVEDLVSIVSHGWIYSDSLVKQRGIDLSCELANEDVKNRRRSRVVACYDPLKVSECVPWYFCPRSPMLFKHYKRNSPRVKDVGGQSFIVHLEADVASVVEWAGIEGLRWCFTNMNAAKGIAQFFCELSDLNQIDWTAVKARYWQKCEARKMAEFLIENQLSLKLVTKIGVHSQKTLEKVVEILVSAGHNTGEIPDVRIEPNWYY